MSRSTPISPKQLRAAGWFAANGYRCYTHESGWYIQHCGHPTALYPYMLYDPAGEPHLAPNGKAWPTVLEAVQYVATQTRLKL